MTTKPFPDAVLEQHIAILGKTGSGKTTSAKLAVEQVVGDGARVCVIDPIKSDWWGLTSSASGKSAGLPFKILGGPRGHVPLHWSSGKVIAELVATGALPLSIVDMANFNPGEHARFFIDFVPTLIRRMRGVVYLVIEEAHLLAPKERSGIGNENMAIHWAKTLATAGRSKGVRLILATQRTQALHNALLGSCDTLIAHRLTTPADQEPVEKWLKSNVKDKNTRETIENSLGELKTGTAWLCSSEAKIFELVAFPRIKTYDNTATPTGDADDSQVKTAPVDQDQLRSLIGDAVKEAEANDPKVLRAEIARLKSDIQKLSVAKTDNNRLDPKAIAAAEQRGFERAKAQVTAAAEAVAQQRMVSALEGVKAVFAPIAQALDVAIADAKKQRPSAQVAFAPSAPPPAPRPAAPTAIPRAAASDSALKRSLQRAVDAIAWWRKIGVEPVDKDRACVVAGLSPRASTFGVYLAELTRLGLVETPVPGKVKLTDAGLEVARAPDAATADELRTMARDLLSPQPAKVFDVIYQAYPDEIHRDAVAEAVGLSPNASTAGVYISEVAAFGIIEVSSRGHVRAADWLFPQ